MLGELTLITALLIGVISELGSGVTSAQPARPMDSGELSAQLIKLAKRVYPLREPEAAADEVSALIKREQRALSSEGMTPLDALGALQRERNNSSVSTPLTFTLDQWRALPGIKRFRRKDFTGARVSRFAQRLLSSSPQSAQTLKELRELIRSVRGGSGISAGLLEGSYALGLENVARGVKLLNPSRSRGERAIRETLTLFQDATRYLERRHARGERISGEQLTLIALGRVICYVALDQMSEAQRALNELFTLPSEGEALIRLREVIKPELESSKVKSFDRRRRGIKIVDRWVERFSELDEELERWVGLTRAPRTRLRKLKGGARDLIRRHPELKAWWRGAAPKLRRRLANAESKLALTQLALAAATVKHRQHERADHVSEIEWSLIPKGSLWLSHPDHPDQLVEVKVKRAFLLARSEVTVEQYQRCVRAGVCSPPHWERCELWDGRRYYRGPAPPNFREPRRPVVCVDWRQARAFSRWVGGDLPSESEWMYAAQSAGQGVSYPWGEAEASCERAVMNEQGGTGCGRHGSWDVCSRSLGLSEQGVCDLAGNVWEWTLDESAQEGAQPLELPPLDASPHCRDAACEAPSNARVARGGGWGSGASYLKTTSRVSFKNERAHLFLGFRPKRSLY